MTESRRGRSAILRIGVLLLLFGGASLVGYRLGWFDYSHTLQHVARLRRSQNLGVFVAGFIVIYALGTGVGLPGLPFNVAAGALFGAVIGGVLAWGGSLLGAATGYWIARTIGHEEVLRWTSRYKRGDTAISQASDFMGMLRLRLIPVLPIGIVNFAGGLARAPFGTYLLATAIGILPSVAVYCYFADSLVEGVGAGRSTALTSLIVASALLLLISLGPRLVRARSSRA